MKVSRETRSKAYAFVKSMLNDGADGEDVHNLVKAISEHVNADVAGTILMDLIANRDEEIVQEKDHNMWFGPVNVRYYHVIIREWNEYCKENDINGRFQFGELDIWKEWNHQGKHGLSSVEVKDLSKKSHDSIMVFDWKSDQIVANEVREFISDLHDRLKETVKEESK